MRAAAPALSLLLCCTASANAQQPEPDCRKAVTQMDLNICADQDYRAADAELNKTYRLAVAAMPATDKELGDIDAAYAGALEALKKAQRAWIGYRDGQCELAGFEARGGSMEPMLVSGCLAELTRKRTAELKELMESAEN
ncbi:lysozyme inhibitor LprI family protein [Sinorhizobium meliloti]|uniref:lysozyme inhibitor LprI family protein n=1 Tax=Rhizobium meliloti TaxID=382 RepID=UPI000FDCA5F4|nr:lysozyme inhibitor LprI family protein [Sinorhizobium meliloti]RVE90242.1 lysozyme inhibitor LprI family protein [Sinorhizobium meliloti]RVH32026.1 lysozyme inhibitor LprI family protein [Sinorhizobium meliloti]